MSANWYWLLPDHSIMLGPGIDDMEAFRRYSSWLYGETDGRYNKVVEKTQLKDCLVSTVFLGLDHSFDEGCPVLFETMVFEGPDAGYMERYHTWDEAVAGHERIVMEQAREKSDGKA